MRLKWALPDHNDIWIFVYIDKIIMKMILRLISQDSFADIKNNWIVVGLFLKIELLKKIGINMVYSNI